MSGTRFPFIIGHPPTSIYMAGNDTMDKQTTTADGYTFDINTFFGEKITLAEILAARVHHALTQKSLDNQEKTTCLSENSEV